MVARRDADRFKAALKGHPPISYSDEDLGPIAEALAVAISEVIAHRLSFDAAALWFGLQSRRVPRTAPSDLQRKLLQIRRAAARLLRALGIDEANEAADGPVSWEILEAFAFTDGDQDAVTSATSRVGRLAEVVDGLMAARDLERRAEKGADDVRRLGRHIVPEGHQGDSALNGWIGDMMAIYRSVTGETPRTSVGSPTSNDEGEATGPLIRFLEAAARPLEIEKSPDALRRRIRKVLATSPN